MQLHHPYLSSRRYSNIYNSSVVATCKKGWGMSRSGRLSDAGAGASVLRHMATGPHVSWARLQRYARGRKSRETRSPNSNLIFVFDY